MRTGECKVIDAALKYAYETPNSKIELNVGKTNNLKFIHTSPI